MNQALSIKVEDLTRQFGHFTAVDHVSFEVYDGEIFGFLGANGAGKTTTIKMLCGLLLPTSGRGSVEGLDIYTETQKIKQSLGYMSQKFSLYEDLTVGENLEFYGGIYGLDRKAFLAARKRIVASIGLEEHEKKLTRDIPLGWKQRLALACAVLHSPKILFLDEPTAGVDPISRRRFWRLIYDLAASGTTVFVTTHYMDEAEYCHRLAIMHQGVICAIGSPRHLRSKYHGKTIEEVFIAVVQQQKS